MQASIKKKHMSSQKCILVVPDDTLWPYKVKETEHFYLSVLSGGKGNNLVLPVFVF